METKTKLILILFLTTLLGIYGTYTGYNKQPKIVEKVVAVDRIVTKEVSKIRAETRPDGTKVVTETHTDTRKAETLSKSMVMAPRLPRYSLGLGLILDPFNPLKRDYAITTGLRLWTTPAWADLTVSTDKKLTLGLRWEF